MAGGIIKADTSAIKKAAGTIRADAQSYTNQMNSLFEQIEALRSTWTSEDGNQYIAKIQKYQPEFTAMGINLNASAEALETAAVTYEKTVVANQG